MRVPEPAAFLGPGRVRARDTWLGGPPNLPTAAAALDLRTPAAAPACDLSAAGREAAPDRRNQALQRCRSSGVGRRHFARRAAHRRLARRPASWPRWSSDLPRVQHAAHLDCLAPAAAAAAGRQKQVAHAAPRPRQPPRAGPAACGAELGAAGDPAVAPLAAPRSAHFSGGAGGAAEQTRQRDAELCAAARRRQLPAAAGPPLGPVGAPPLQRLQLLGPRRQGERGRGGACAPVRERESRPVLKERLAARSSRLLGGAATRAPTCAARALRQGRSRRAGRPAGCAQVEAVRRPLLLRLEARHHHFALHHCLLRACCKGTWRQDTEARPGSPCRTQQLLPVLQSGRR